MTDREHVVAVLSDVDQHVLGAADTEVVPIASLRSADSPRTQAEDPDHVRVLAQTEGGLPPILVHRSTRRVIDGMHRIRAALLRGAEQIEVRFVDLPEEDLFLLAVRLNVQHGLPLAMADRRAAAARILVSHPHWSDRAIAGTAGLDAKTVRGIRREKGGAPASTPTRIGRDGRTRPLSAAAGRRSAGELVKANPAMPLRQVAQRAGISLGTAADVRHRVMRGEDPVRGGTSRPGDTAGRDEKVAAAREPVAPEGAGPDGASVANLIARRDSAMALRILTADPALRFTDAGRVLLRWLSTRSIDSREWQGLMDEVPAHCAGTVADLARQCSESWREFAEQLERRHRASA
ncbi:ParB/RepB/Spo0J family partition protein [Actinokineospora diospyrosa]|uniref:ParB-like nuclease domain-containing protein n=1 Tax=Actinokineospora diospyrosa TaxID=103728 RepID=A0ABT1IBS7_9PSEU|nr:ParB/RepB/Spo0J family partition protein [Actinokineospora diospyrosa]MCP2270080.1 ParB-like nuclease domain-containing protein [Actinokineospora diospyrosa]